MAKTSATRRGSVNSGVSSFANGWNIGGNVAVSANGENDIVHFVLTKGSNNSHCVASFSISENDLDNIESIVVNYKKISK